MLGMFLGASEFNQDLSEWCVVRIKEEPWDFSFDSDFAETNTPKWGECPVGN